VVPIPGAVIDQAPLVPTADVVHRPIAGRASRNRHAAGAGARRHRGAGFLVDPRHFISGARGAYE